MANLGAGNERGSAPRTNDPRESSSSDSGSSGNSSSQRGARRAVERQREREERRSGGSGSSSSSDSGSSGSSGSSGNSSARRGARRAVERQREREQRRNSGGSGNGGSSDSGSSGSSGSSGNASAQRGARRAVEQQRQREQRRSSSQNSSNQSGGNQRAQRGARRAVEQQRRQRSQSGAQTGSVRAVQQQRDREQQQQSTEQFGDWVVQNPFTGNRLEDDLRNAGQEFTERTNESIQFMADSPFGLYGTKSNIRSAETVSRAAGNDRLGNQLRRDAEQSQKDQKLIAEQITQAANLPDAAYGVKEVGEFIDYGASETASGRGGEFARDAATAGAAVGAAAVDYTRKNPRKAALEGTGMLLGGYLAGSATQKVTKAGKVAGSKSVTKAADATPGTDLAREIGRKTDELAREFYKKPDPGPKPKNRNNYGSLSQTRDVVEWQLRDAKSDLQKKASKGSEFLRDAYEKQAPDAGGNDLPGQLYQTKERAKWKVRDAKSDIKFEASQGADLARDIAKQTDELARQFYQKPDPGPQSKRRNNYGPLSQTRDVVEWQLRDAKSDLQNKASRGSEFLRDTYEKQAPDARGDGRPQQMDSDGPYPSWSPEDGLNPFRKTTIGLGDDSNSKKSSGESPSSGTQNPLPGGSNPSGRSGRSGQQTVQRFRQGGDGNQKARGRSSDSSPSRTPTSWRDAAERGAIGGAVTGPRASPDEGFSNPEITAPQFQPDEVTGPTVDTPPGLDNPTNTRQGQENPPGFQNPPNTRVTTRQQFDLDNTQRQRPRSRARPRQRRPRPPEPGRRKSAEDDDPNSKAFNIDYTNPIASGFSVLGIGGGGAPAPSPQQADRDIEKQARKRERDIQKQQREFQKRLEKQQQQFGVR